MNPKALFFIFITVFCWGLTPVLEKIGLEKTDPFLGVALRSLAIFFPIWIYVFLSGKYKLINDLSPKSIGMFLLSGVLAGLLAMIFYFMALKEGQASKIVPIVAAYPLIAFFLSVFILKEPFTINKVLGTVLIAVGIVFLKI